VAVTAAAWATWAAWAVTKIAAAVYDRRRKSRAGLEENPASLFHWSAGLRPGVWRNRSLHHNQPCIGATSLTPPSRGEGRIFKNRGSNSAKEFPKNGENLLVFIV
jgi:hypothetical protein